MECYGIIDEKSITFSILNICEKQCLFCLKIFFCFDQILLLSCYFCLREKPQNVSKKSETKAILTFLSPMLSKVFYILLKLF